MDWTPENCCTVLPFSETKIWFKLESEKSKRENYAKTDTMVKDKRQRTRIRTYDTVKDER